MSNASNSILLIGEYAVGKTHYGAQLLKRLMKADGKLRMRGAASNLEPFEAALESLNEGMAAGHTAGSIYLESAWPIADEAGREAELIWPDYSGEQIKTMLEKRSVPKAWVSRIASAPAWLLLIRLTQLRSADDIFSRPLAKLKTTDDVKNQAQIPFSDQARLIELLQMLLHASVLTKDQKIQVPHLTVLLTCWDELPTFLLPVDALRKQLPMFCDFVLSNWVGPNVLGLSALGKPLNFQDRDLEYVTRGPEHFGYVVLQDGTRSPDLTLPIKMALTSLS